jgi:hypothetical protein
MGLLTADQFGEGAQSGSSWQEPWEQRGMSTTGIGSKLTSRPSPGSRTTTGRLGA